MKNINRRLASILSPLFLSLCLCPLSVNAAQVLSVDLSVTNQITVSATAGTSLATIFDSSDTLGFYLADLFGGGTNDIDDGLVSGNLTSANQTSNNSPDLFRASNDTGLNVYNYSSDDTSSFTAGLLAFSGSAAWDITAGAYTDALNGSTSGNVYFPADRISDVSNAYLIGIWSRTSEVPIPAAAWLFGSGLLGLAAMKRKRS